MLIRAALSAGLLPLLLLTVPASSQELDRSRLEKVGKRLVKMRHGPQLASKNEFLAAGFDETAAALDHLARAARTGASAAVLSADLAAEIGRLQLLDREYEALFADIEAKLRNAGLAAELPKLARFTAHYRQRMSALEQGLRDAAEPGQNMEAKLRELRATLRPAQVPGDALRAAEPAPLDAASIYNHVISQPHAAETDLPTAADLAENRFVRFTPEIRAKAAELRGSPRLIYQYVRNNIEYEPYLLLMQGSESIPWSGRGNDADIASYLIALLRASGTPARYSLLTAQIPMADFISWLGVKNQSAAQGMLDRFVSARISGNSVATLLFTVEAYTDTPNGKAWVPLDAGFKTRESKPGIVVPLPLFDRAQYLNAPNSQLASHVYLDQFRAALAKTNPGAALSDAAYDSSIVPDQSDSLPQSLPYAVTGEPRRYSDLSNLGLQHQVSVEVVDPSAANASIVKTTMNTADVLTHSLTVEFAPATGASNAALAAAFGGVENTPVFLLSDQTAQIRLDGRVIATGKQAVNLENLEIRVGYYIGPLPDLLKVRHPIFAGQTAAIVFNGYQSTDRYLGSRIDNFLEKPGLGVGDAQSATRDLLRVAGLRYFNRIMQERNRLATPLQLRYINSFADEAMVLAYAGVQSLFDRPFLFTPSRMVLDAAAINQSFENLNSNTLSTPELVGVRQASGLTGSSLEHELWEELLLTRSVSTTKLLQLARSSGGALQSIDSSNSAAVLARLQLPAAVSGPIRTDLAANKTVLITDRPVTLGTYRGYAWISEDRSGIGAYLIANVRGGDSGTGPYVPVLTNPGPAGNPLITNGTACSDPVTVSNGNMFHSVIDLSISSRGPDFVLSRTYNSLLASTDGPLGFGWTHSYNMSVRESAGTITFTNGSGGSFPFSLQAGAYRSPVLPQLVITKDAQGYLLRHKNGTQFRFNAAGKLITIADRVNNSLQFAYDASGRLTRATDALDRSVSFTYNGQGRITTVQDFSGRRTAYEYDGGGNLAAAIDLGGLRTIYAYYSGTPFQHLLRSITTPGNKVTTYEYYADRKAARTVEPGGRTARFLYLPLRNETVVIDGRGFATSFFYNAFGSVTRIIKPDGNFADRQYTASAQLAAFTDESGATAKYEYDALGNLTAITNPLGARTQYTYEPLFNRVATVRDRKGAITTFEYDAAGNMTRVAGPLGAETKFTYNSFGQVLTAANAEGAITSFAYDSAGNVAKVTDPLGNIHQMEYDSLRRPKRAVDPAGNARTLDYDVFGRILRSVNPLGDAASMRYNADGVLSELTDAAGRVTQYGYDSLNNLNQVTGPLGDVAAFDFNIADCGCSASDNLVSYRDAAGRTSAFAYNSQDRLTSSTDSLGNKTQFAYNGRQTLAAVTNANGIATGLEHDAAGRLIRRTVAAGVDAQFSYDVSGNLVTAANQHVTYTFGYDELNRLKSVTDSRFNKTISYAYDRLGRRTLVTDTEGGVVSYAWDPGNRLASITGPSGASARFDYDALGRRVSATYSNGVVSAYSYDAASRVTSLAHGAMGSFAYTYDKSGNPVAVADASGEHAYQYDELNRLTAASHLSTPGESYRYDGAGNRLASAADSGYSYDQAGRLVVAEGFSYQYDNAGNLIEKSGESGATRYSYDASGRLTAIALPDGSAVSYKYDPLGRRIEKNVNGAVTAYIYDGPNIIAELDAGGSLQARYIHGPGLDRPLIMERAGQPYFYHSDRLGSIAALSDSAGAAVCSYRYDSFGRTQACTDLANPYAFAGREYDAESGLYYLRARYYDPVTGRFTTPDPLDITGLTLLRQNGIREAFRLRRLPQHLNTYSYAVNNPMVYRDPMGLKGCGDSAPPDSPVLIGSTYRDNRTFLGDLWSTVSGDSGGANRVVAVTNRRGEVLNDFYGRLVQPESGEPYWQMYESDTGLATTATVPLTEEEKRQVAEAEAWRAANPDPTVLQSIANTGSDIYHAYVDLGVTSGLVDQQYASDAWRGRP